MSVLRRALRHRLEAAKSAAENPRLGADARARYALRAEVYEEVLELIRPDGEATT